MTVRVNKHYRIISAISVEIKSVNGFRIEEGDIVSIYESACFRVVISRIEIIQSRFLVKIVASVSERICVAYRAFISQEADILYGYKCASYIIRCLTAVFITIL